MARFRQGKNSHIEDDHQATLFQWAAFVSECKWLHAIPNGGNRNVKEAARLKKQGVKAGVLDVFLPVARGGYHGLYIELKRPRKSGPSKVTDKQKEFIADQSAEGYLCVVCYSAGEAIQVIKDYLKLKR